MRVDLHARVRTRDGKEAGRIRHTIFDPNTGDVTNFVISTGGHFGRDVLVPRDALLPPELVGETAGEEGTLVLNLSKAELDELADFVASDYSIPPAGWEPPSEQGFRGEGFLWAGSCGVEPSPPALDRQGEGTRSSWAATSLTQGAAVLDREGDHVGVVEELQVDPESGELRGVVVRVGGQLQILLGSGDTVVVPGELIAGVGQNEISLLAGKEELHRMARPRKGGV